jgi:hypothetical protein
MTKIGAAFGCDEKDYKKCKELMYLLKDIQELSHNKGLVNHMIKSLENYKKHNKLTEVAESNRIIINYVQLQ